MGFLDCIAGIMQIFAATYLDGGLIVLLLQAAIPVSMVLSRYFLNTTYHKVQYLSAVVVVGGIVTVLAPSLSTSSGGSNVVIWGSVLIASCIPMCLSSIYKELALGDTDLDPIYVRT